ncbi:MAG: hypothetical protein HYV75_05150 [Opitutae bacterium]|nr:hypothetical protein [Opitutae bacterium]
MNYPVSGRLPAAVLVIPLLFLGRASAQTTETKPADSAAPPAAATPLKDEVVVLSPFRVNAEKDEGFVATSSLAGGRLNTDLKNTPVAYSVLTRDFLDALTLTDQEQALTWSVGSYMPIVSLSAYRYNDNEGGSSIITRGQQTNGAQRNFFHLSLNTDTYNEERIDFARGPNALLFGTNGLGGVVNTITKQARFDKAFNRVGLLVGSWNKFRTTFDVNAPINDQAAARFNFLWQNANTWRDLEFDNRRGVHLTTTYKPWRRTQVRAEYEYYLQSTIMGRETMSETFSGWDGVTTVAAPGTLTIASSDNKGVSKDGSATSPFRIYIPGTDAGTVMNWANTWRTMGGAANANVPVGGQFALSTANLGINFGPMIDSYYSYDLLYGKAEAGSFFKRSLYSTRETVIQPHLPTLEYSHHNAALYVEHQQGEHLFFEAAGYHAQTQKHVETAASRMGQAVIDVNQTLPNGAPNPNFKQVYSEALASSFYYHNRISEARAAMAAQFNDTRWGDFVGNVNIGFRQIINGLNADTSVMNRNPDIRRRSVDDNFTYRFYWNSPDQPLVYPDRVNYVDPVAGTTTSYTVSKVTDLRSIGTLRASDTLYTYLQGSLQAKLFKNRLALFAGARRDTVNAKNYSAGNTNNTMADYPVDWDGHTLYWRPTGPSDYFNLKYMVKDANGVPTTGVLIDAGSRPRDSANGFKPLPQYANDRFRDDYSAPEVDIDVTTLNYGGVLHVRPWLSAFSNYAESFRPPSAGVTMTGQSLPSSRGEGWDVGFRLHLLKGRQGQDRIYASFGKYGGRQVDGAFDNTGNSRKYATIIDANAVGDLSANGQNKRGLGQFSTITFDFSDARNYGYEIDIVANLTNNWRLTANAGFPHNLSSIPVASRSPDASAAATAWNNIVQFKATNDPKAVGYSDQPKVTSNLYTDYRFTRGLLKNLRVGGGVQYFARTAIGNRGGDTIVNPADSTKAIDDPAVDATTRVYRSAYYTVTGTVGYQFKLGNGVPVDLNLKVGNLLGNDDLIYIGAGLRAPGGDIKRPDRITVPTTFVYLQPRSISLSATVSF